MSFGSFFTWKTRFLCFFRDLEAIKEQAIWMEDSQKFKLPDLVIYRTKLPPPGTENKKLETPPPQKKNIPLPGRPSDIQTAPGRLESDSESFDDDSDNKNSLIKVSQAKQNSTKI